MLQTWPQRTIFVRKNRIVCNLSTPTSKILSHAMPVLSLLAVGNYKLHTSCTIFLQCGFMTRLKTDFNIYSSRGIMTDVFWGIHHDDNWAAAILLGIFLWPLNWEEPRCSKRGPRGCRELLLDMNHVVLCIEQKLTLYTNNENLHIAQNIGWTMDFCRSVLECLGVVRRIGAQGWVWRMSVYKIV